MKLIMLILYCATLFHVGETSAQGIEEMLLYQIEGNQYLRKNFDAQGHMKNYQTIDVGELKFSTGIIESKMTVVNYDRKGNLLSASQTTIRCNPEEREVLMGVFPFAGAKSDKALKIELKKGASLYPNDWFNKNSLPDFNFKLQVEGGVAGFLGTESQTAITQRKVMLQPNGLYKVSGKMTLNAYLAGINISTTVYDFFEYIDLLKGIVWQKFVNSNGEYFTIELNKASGN